MAALNLSCNVWSLLFHTVSMNRSKLSWSSFQTWPFCMTCVHFLAVERMKGNGESAFISVSWICFLDGGRGREEDQSGRRRPCANEYIWILELFVELMIAYLSLSQNKPSMITDTHSLRGGWWGYWRLRHVLFWSPGKGGGGGLVEQC